MQDNNLYSLAMCHFTILNFAMMPSSRTRTSVTWAFTLSCFILRIRITCPLCVHYVCIMGALASSYVHYVHIMYQLEAAYTQIKNT